MLDNDFYFSHLNASWNKTEKTSPNARCSWSGTTIYQSTDDSNNEVSQKKALAISIIIRIGSAAIVNMNMDIGGPKARRAQPKNSISVIFTVVDATNSLCLIYYYTVTIYSSERF
ncbi:hypothetical protein WN55_11443 [Dufourea novaeangliae]|uniref:Uncharacterized protein n=1 Tax=Dufourea novaeangliae TaxID=178035 RepID=A0A154PCQ3_DUFNO|nr:hypothetical protein WN55_11443 [Dufourea novaeangliae]